MTSPCPGAADSGECGATKYADVFSINGKYYQISVSPDWNRHDKTFYFIDGWNESSVVEIEATPEMKGSVGCLWDTFGGTYTETGHKVLHERIGLIYGDSITLDRAEQILAGLKAKGFASCNICFGIGSFSFVGNVTRDTFSMAMKCTYVEVDHVGIEVYKDPKTDPGKKSAKGLLRVEMENGNYVLYDQQSWEQEAQGCLQTVFKDGKVIRDESITTIRDRLSSY